MAKSGVKPQGKVKIEWSADFAYAIGLIATDGCLYSDRKYINFTSKDLEQILNFQKALKIDIHVGRKARGGGGQKKYFVIQFGDAYFYDFLVEIGITPKKSKTLGKVYVPDKYFFDFLRGVFDGDGHSYSYWDKRWKSSFLFYIGFSSASIAHLHWIQARLKETLSIHGRINSSFANACFQLEYAKTEALKIIPVLYPKKSSFLYLSRKRLKIERILAIVAKQLSRIG